MVSDRNSQAARGHIVEEYYLYFAADLVDLQKYLPDYMTHPHHHHIKKYIELFSSDPKAYDPRAHSFNTTKLSSDTEIGHMFFIIAAEYVKSLQLKKMDWKLLKEKIREAFNPHVARKKDKQVVVCTKPFAPLDFNTLLDHVIPHVVAAQAKRYLDAFALSEKEQTSLECQLLQFSVDTRDNVLGMSVEVHPELSIGMDEFHNPEYQSLLFRDFTQAVWNDTYLQKHQLSFKNQEAYLKYVISLFEPGGALYDKYTKPVTQRKENAHLTYKQITREFFPALLLKAAKDDDLVVIPIERGLCTATEYPQAPFVDDGRAIANEDMPQSLNAIEKPKGLDAFIKEDYIQVPEETPQEAAKRMARANQQVAPVTKSQAMANNALKFASKVANTTASLFSRSNPKNQKPEPEPKKQSVTHRVVIN